jgi:hypothetical protein
MIITLLIISTAAAFAAAWASKQVSIGILIAMAGAVWVAGVLLINKGITDMSAPVEQPSGLVSLGMILILTGLAMSTALAVGRLLRGKLQPLYVGFIGGGLTLICMMFFYAVAIGI